MAKKKVMEFDLFKELEVQYQEKSKIVKVNGKEVVIKVDEKFKPSKIDDMVKVAIGFINEAREKEIKINENDLIVCMVATTFSNVPVKVESVEDVVRVISGLIDLKDEDGVSFLVHIYSMIDEEEVKKINSHIKSLGESVKLKLDELKTLKNKVVE